MVLIENEFQIASFCDLRSVLKGFRTVGEQFLQFRFTLEIEFICLKLQFPVRVVQRSIGLDADHHILHLGIFFAKIVGVIGDDQRQTGFSGDPHDTLIGGTLLLNAVILQFQIKVVLTEDFGHMHRIGFRTLIVFLQQMLRYCAGKAGRCGDQTFVVLFQQFQIDTGLTVKATNVSLGDQ